MNFCQAKTCAEGCIQNYDAFKKQFHGKERQLLEDSYLVVDYFHGQLKLSELKPEEIVLHHPKLLAYAGQNWAFTKLVRRKAWLLSQIEKLQKELQYTQRRIENSNTEILELNQFTLELRFKQLDFDLINKIKQSELADKKKTNMSNASIRIALKGESE